MYVPTAFEQLDLASLTTAIRANPLGMMVTVSDGHPEVNHLPFVFADAEGPCGTLRGHVAKANSVWRGAHGTEALIVFSGPNSYVSPSWYPTKKETARVVPTWNYVVVHARGHIRVVHDVDWLRAHLGSLVDEHESHRNPAWRVTDAPADFVDALLLGIVGIEIRVSTLSGKWKLSQNRSERDRQGVIQGLMAEGPQGVAVANAMRGPRNDPT